MALIRSFIAFFICTACLLESKESDSLLILNMKNEVDLPRNFRTTKEAFQTNEKVTLPTRKGLDELKLSGSSQFSEKGLEAILDKLNHPSCLYIIDLRQESHGFLNGTAVSWYAPKDWGNVGKTLREVESSEKQLLEDSLQRKDINVYRIVKKDKDGNKLPDTISIPLTISKASTEKEVVTSRQIEYLRLPVTDHIRPSDAIVDEFVAFVRKLPKDCWVHIHCAAGVGRTTTFMAMYDMMFNAKDVSFDDIIKRQWLIGGLNLKKVSDKYPWKYPYAVERFRFIKAFYEYSRDNQDGFQKSWSTYVRERLQKPFGKDKPVFDKDHPTDKPQ